MKIIIKENKMLLNEVSLKDVLDTCESKKTKRKIFNIIINSGKFSEEKLQDKSYVEYIINQIIKHFKTYIKLAIPDDIEENQKGAAANWIKNNLLDHHQYFFLFHFTDEKEDKRIYALQDFISEKLYPRLEMFFHANRFIPEPYSRDINAYEDLDDIRLEEAVAIASKAYREHQKKKSYLDSEQGSELIYEDESWKIYIPRNKGAACELGKGTDWCTAAPGLEFYKQYHKDNDPLFIFINKQTPELKYQFHYGTDQFMDVSDHRVPESTFNTLHALLLKSPIAKKTIPERYQNPIKQSEDVTVYKKFSFYNDSKNLIIQGVNEHYDNYRGQLMSLEGPAIIEISKVIDTKYTDDAVDFHGFRTVVSDYIKLMRDKRDEAGYNEIDEDQLKKYYSTISTKNRNFWILKSPNLEISWYYKSSKLCQLTTNSLFKLNFKIEWNRVEGGMSQLENVFSNVYLPMEQFDITQYNSKEDMVRYLENLKKYLHSIEDYNKANRVIKEYIERKIALNKQKDKSLSESKKIKIYIRGNKNNAKII